MHESSGEKHPNPNFIVITGLRSFPLFAHDPIHAITIVKERINERRYRRKDPFIGVSLLTALDEGRLNFIVMDYERTALLCGELNALGDQRHLNVFQQHVSRELADSLADLIPLGLMPWRDYPTDSDE